MKKRWLAGLGLAALLATVAIAQTIGTFNLTGNEDVRAMLGPGGGDILVPAYVLRSGENHTLVATGTNITTTTPATSGIVLATGAITTWFVILPTSPYTGQKVQISCPGGDTTTLVITATSPSGVAIAGTNPTSCTAATPTSSGWTYSTSAITWYRYR